MLLTLRHLLSFWEHPPDLTLSRFSERSVLVPQAGGQNQLLTSGLQVAPTLQGGRSAGEGPPEGRHHKAALQTGLKCLFLH